MESAILTGLGLGGASGQGAGGDISGGCPRPIGAPHLERFDVRTILRRLRGESCCPKNRSAPAVVSLIETHSGSKRMRRRDTRTPAAPVHSTRNKYSKPK